jgi:hypothetical protein
MFTRRCPVCDHPVEVRPLEPGQDVWRFAHHDVDGYSLVMQPRGPLSPWRERVIDPDDLI